MPLIVLGCILVLKFQLIHGQACKTYPALEDGSCIPTVDCPHLYSMLKHLQDKGPPHNSTLLTTLQRSASACDSRSRVCCKTPLLPRKCGIRRGSDFIVGGVKSDWIPWIVVFHGSKYDCTDKSSVSNCEQWANLGYCEEQYVDYMVKNCAKTCNKCGAATQFCGGSLISPRYVLSAAHCFVAETGIIRNTITARFGELDLRTDPDWFLNQKGPKVQEKTVKFIHSHPDYKRNGCTKCNDLSVVELTDSVEFIDGYVFPVCLPVSPEVDMGFSIMAFQGKEAETAGWGKSDVKDIFSTIQTNHLQKVFLNIQTTPWCEERLKNHPVGEILCAGNGDGKDTCRGDSGGPLMLKSERQARFFLVGVASYGPTVCGAAGTQSVFTSVYHYIPWIKEILEKSSTP